MYYYFPVQICLFVRRSFFFPPEWVRCLLRVIGEDDGVRVFRFTGLGLVNFFGEVSGGVL